MKKLFASENKKPLKLFVIKNIIQIANCCLYMEEIYELCTIIN